MSFGVTIRSPSGCNAVDSTSRISEDGIKVVYRYEVGRFYIWESKNDTIDESVICATEYRLHSSI